jgi:hypothetical protein
VHAAVSSASISAMPSGLKLRRPCCAGRHMSNRS